METRRIVSLDFELRCRDTLDHLRGVIPLGNIEISREFVLKFNGLTIWDKTEN